jgi:hypothetical protein
VFTVVITRDDKCSKTVEPVSGISNQIFGKQNALTPFNNTDYAIQKLLHGDRSQTPLSLAT